MKAYCDMLSSVANALLVFVYDTPRAVALGVYLPLKKRINSIRRSL